MGAKNIQEVFEEFSLSLNTAIDFEGQINAGKRTEIVFDEFGNQLIRIIGKLGDGFTWMKCVKIPPGNMKGEGRRDAILQMEREGFSRSEIANTFQISESRVSQIMNKKRKKRLL